MLALFHLLFCIRLCCSGLQPAQCLQVESGFNASFLDIDLTLPTPVNYLQFQSVQTVVSLMSQPKNCLFLYAVSFDDSSWPKAVASKTFKKWGQPVDGVDASTSAWWIWTANAGLKGQAAPADPTVCCRVYFGK